MNDLLYTYKVSQIHSIYDGDTMTVDIDLGFNMIMGKRVLRLFGIDTPELRGEEREEGLKVRDYVRELVEEVDEIYIKSHKDKSGKYGRILATVLLVKDEVVQDLNEHLLEKGMAKPYGK